MQVKTRTHKVHTVEFEGREVELQFAPYSGDDILIERVGDTLVVAYLAHDDDADDDLGDGMGTLYSFHKHSPREGREVGLRAIGRDGYGNLDDDIDPNPDAVILDCYDHSSQHWSVNGEGYQCQWDTARGAGVWVPDDVLKSQLDDDEKSGLNRHDKAVEYCRQFLDQYNAASNGEVFGCVTQIFERVTFTGSDEDMTWEELDSDHCWGHIGYKYAQETLQSEYFDPTVAGLKAAA